MYVGSIKDVVRSSEYKHEEGQRIYRPKRCRNNNKDEDNSPKTLNDKIIKLRLRNSDNYCISL